MARVQQRVSGNTPDEARDVHPPPVSAAALLERMTDAFIALDRDWRVEYMNAAALRLDHRPASQLIGRSHWELWPQTVGGDVERQYRRAMDTQQPVRFEHHYMMPGRDYWHAIAAYPDADGLSIFFRDVTLEKRTDDLARLLARASERFISATDSPAMLRVVGEMALPLLGDWSIAYLVDETLRVTMVDIAAVDPKDLDLLRLLMAQMPAAPDPGAVWMQAMRRGEPVLLSRLDDDFYASLGTSAARDFMHALEPRSLLSVPLMARGRVIGGVTFGRSMARRPHDEHDVLAAREVAVPAGLALDMAGLHEAQRRAALAAEDARRRAEDANRWRLESLRAMSHEMRTPLNAVGGYVQLLLSGVRGEISAAVRADLERIERNHVHVSRLIDETLHFARLEAGRVRFEAARVTVASLLEGLPDFVPPGQKARGRQVVVRPCPADLAVLADRDKARQILVNLLGNALKHTPLDATVEIFADSGGALDSHARVVVKDTGPGIPVERQQSIFEPFVQVGRDFNNPVEGLGLGLTIARELARGMGGDLTVSSEPGKGASFVLALRRHG